MTTEHRRAEGYLEKLLAQNTAEELVARLSPKSGDAPPRVHGGRELTEAIVEQRWELLPVDEAACAAVFDDNTRRHLDLFRANIENFVGTVKMPVGVAGPLRVNGLFAQGDYYVPLATTEAALVASHARGAMVITQSGGCTAALLNEGMHRSPGFAFDSIIDAGRFVQWATTQMDAFRAQAESTTQHGRLLDMQVTVEGNHVYLNFQYETGDASGQNMVTIATEAICRYIRDKCPIASRYSFLEANLSGDKKASAQSFTSVRGKKVTAEVTVPARLVEHILHTTPRDMVNYWRMSSIGGVLSGTMGVHGQFANGLAAMWIACGQDAACVAESTMGVTRFELTDDGNLYAAVTLPSLVVGTVGGGTGLPSQHACLEILGLAGPGKAQAFAEVCTALVLAGELSLIGVLAAGDFAGAHERLARGRRDDST